MNDILEKSNVPFILITPIRHPHNSNNYDHVIELFEASARSICAQENQQFKLIVVCNQIPEMEFEHKNIIFHVVDFPIPSKEKSSAIPLENLKRDKGTKLLSGLLLAQKYNPEYIFFIDADDWIDRKLISYILNRKPEKMWYADTSYLVNLKKQTLKRIGGMTRYCGSTIIYHNSVLVPYLEDTKNRNIDEKSSQNTLLENFNSYFIHTLLGDHVESYHLAVKKQWRPQPLPFISMCWVTENGENHSASQNKNRKKHSNKNQGTPITEKTCTQFGLSKDYQNNITADFSSKLRERLSFKKSQTQWFISKILKRNIY